MLQVPTTPETTEDQYFERMTLMLRFVKGYYDYKYWTSLDFAKKYEHVEQETLNLFQWILFYNDHQLLDYLLHKTQVGKRLLLTQALIGDHDGTQTTPLNYVLTTPDGKEYATLRFEKVGLLIALAKRSFECLKILFLP